MSFLTEKKYILMLILHFLLLFDLCINSFSTFAKSKPSDLLFIFVVQDFCLVIALTIFLASIFSTYLFQAGLIQILFVQFRVALVICILYITLSICLHSWYMVVHYIAPLKHYWPISYHCLYSIHRATAVLYYCLIKNASLRLNDPNFYNPSKWIQRPFSIT